MPAQEITDQSDRPATNTSSAAAAGRKMRPGLSLRRFTSLLLTLAFAVMCFSGVLLFLTPRGRIANWTDWTLLGLGKHDWMAIHVNNSVLFIVIAIVHLVLNWSVFVRYIKSKAVAGLNMTKELVLASVIAAACVAGPIYEIPPFSSLMALNEDIKDYWEQRAAGRAEQPPVPHAEELTLAELAERINLSVEQVCSALAGQGYQAGNASLTVRQVAEQKGVAPNAVFAAIRQRFPESRGWGRVTGPGGHGGGPNQAESTRRDNTHTGDGVRPEDSTEAHRDGGEGRGPGAGWGRGRGMGLGRGMGRGMGRVGSGQAENPSHQGLID